MFDFEDIAQLIFFAVLGILWLLGKIFGKKTPEAPRPRHVPHPEEAETHAPHRGERHPHGEERPHPVPVEHPRRRSSSELPSQAPPPSRRIQQARPKPLESSRREGHDAPLSDFDGRRALPGRGDSLAPTAPAEPRAAPVTVSADRLQEAIVWREILGPPRSRR